MPQLEGLPISVEMRVVSSSIRPWMSCEARARISVRSATGRSDQSVWSKVWRAAATARSTSALVASGTRPATSSVNGLMTSMVPVPDGSTSSPPMYRRSCSITCSDP